MGIDSKYVSSSDDTERYGQHQSRGDPLRDKIGDRRVVLTYRAAQIEADHVADPDEIGLVPGFVEAVEPIEAGDVFGGDLLARVEHPHIGGEGRTRHLADERVDAEGDDDERQHRNGQSA
jgi:hypothetical protein